MKEFFISVFAAMTAILVLGSCDDSDDGVQSPPQKKIDTFGFIH